MSSDHQFNLGITRPCRLTPYNYCLAVLQPFMRNADIMLKIQCSRKCFDGNDLLDNHSLVKSLL